MLSSKISIRLERAGRYNFALYNIVVVKSKHKQRTKFYSKIGMYIPLYNSRFLFLNLKHLSFWLSRGAIAKGRLSHLILNLLKFK